MQEDPASHSPPSACNRFRKRKVEITRKLFVVGTALQPFGGPHCDDGTRRIPTSAPGGFQIDGETADQFGPFVVGCCWSGPCRKGTLRCPSSGWISSFRFRGVTAGKPGYPPGEV